MRFSWINKKTVTAVSVLTFSCVAAAFSVASHLEQPIAIEVQSSSQESAEFVNAMLDLEASIYGYSVEQTATAKTQLHDFYQKAQASINKPESNKVQSIAIFMQDVDSLLKKNFTIGDKKLSATDGLTLGSISHDTALWVLMEVARNQGLEASLSRVGDHNHVAIKSSDRAWVDWKVDHLIDQKSMHTIAMDDYDLWTELDLAVVDAYVATNSQVNDDSVEALLQAAMSENDAKAFVLYTAFQANTVNSVALVQ